MQGRRAAAAAAAHGGPRLPLRRGGDVPSMWVTYFKVLPSVWVTPASLLCRKPQGGGGGRLPCVAVPQHERPERPCMRACEHWCGGPMPPLLSQRVLAVLPAVRRGRFCSCKPSPFSTNEGKEKEKEKAAQAERGGPLLPQFMCTTQTCCPSRGSYGCCTSATLSLL